MPSFDLNAAPSGLAAGMSLPNRAQGLSDTIKAITNDLRAAATSRQEQADKLQKNALDFRNQNIDMFGKATSAGYRLKRDVHAEDFLNSGRLDLFEPPKTMTEQMQEIKGMMGNQGGQGGYGEPNISYDPNSGKTGLNWKPATQDPKVWERFSDALDPTKNVRTPLGIAKIAFDKSERIESLLNRFPTGDLRESEMEELAIGINSILQGGAGGGSGTSESLIRGLMPKTAVGDIQKIKEFLFNKPFGMKQQEFVRRMASTVQSEKATTAAQIKRAQYQRLAAFNRLAEKDPEQYYQILMSAGIEPDEYEQWKANGYNQIDAAQAGGAGNMLKGGAISPEDQQAIAWAQANQSDPRAHDIIQVIKKKYPGM